MEKIIATGLIGMVGSRVRELLVNRYEFVNLSLPEYDILDEKSLKKAFREHEDAKLVLHLAAFTDVQKAWEERGNKGGSCYRVNVLGTKNVAELAAEFQMHLIHISTDFVFNGQKKGLYTEEDEPKPIEWYGETKYLAEKEVSRTLPFSTIVRLSFPYRTKYPAKVDLVRRLIEKFEQGNLHPMFADQITTLTFTDDIVLGLDKIFIRRPKGIFHLTGSTSQSPYELALAIADVFGLDKELVKKGSLAEYTKTQSEKDRPWHMRLAISNEKAREKLGIKMSTLREGLEKMKAQLEG